MLTTDASSVLYGEGSVPGSSRFEYRTKHRWVIGHDPIRAQIQEFMHFVGVVDGPHVHLETRSVGPLHEASIDHRHPFEPVRHLDTRALHPTGGQPEGASPQASYGLRSE